MISYFEVPIEARIFYLLLFFLTEVNNIALLAFSFLQPDAFKERKVSSILLVLQIVVGYNIIASGVQVERVIAGVRVGGELPLIYDIEAAIIVDILVVMVSYSLYRTVELATWWASHLSAFSIKHSMDALPEGLCYYDQEGRIYIINTTMSEIAYALTGSVIKNAIDFYNDVRNLKIVPEDSVIINEEDLIVISSGDAVFSFRNTAVKDEFGVYYELKVADITEEYSKTRELYSKQVELRKQQKYLSQLGESIKQVTIKKEILAAKIKVHDKLGENLIAARRYLATGEGDIEAIRNLWIDNLTLLSNPQTDTVENPLNSILAAADDIGIKLVWEGDVNDEMLLSNSTHVSNSVLVLLANTLHECITNTMRHAHGDTVYVNISSDFRSMVFRNNGVAPTNAVHESGGLLNIRRQSAETGYRMVIISHPEFNLMLKSIL